jgi:hypothetical protein
LRGDTGPLFICGSTGCDVDFYEEDAHDAPQTPPPP